MEESEWKLEPEGEAEVQEIIIVSDVVDVDLDGKSRREQAEERSFRREREVPSEEGEEVKSPSGIRRNAGLRKRSNECGARRSGREDFRAERDKRSVRAVVSL